MIPEELGVAVGELYYAATVLQDIGRSLGPSPLLGTTWAELTLLAAPEPDTETLESLAAGTSIGALVLYTDYVVNGDTADFVAAAEDGRLSRWTQFSAQPAATVDPTCRLAALRPQGTVALGPDPRAGRHRGDPAGAEHCLQLTVELHQEPCAIRQAYR